MGRGRVHRQLGVDPAHREHERRIHREHELGQVHRKSQVRGGRCDLTRQCANGDRRSGNRTPPRHRLRRPPLSQRETPVSPLVPMPAAMPVPMVGRSGSPAVTTNRHRPAARSFIFTRRTTVSIRRLPRPAPSFSSASATADWCRAKCRWLPAEDVVLVLAVRHQREAGYTEDQ